MVAGNFVQTFLGDGAGNFTLKEATLFGRREHERIDRPWRILMRTENSM